MDDEAATVRDDPAREAPFELFEQVGEGGMGTVYRAKERATGRIVALKVLRERRGDFSRFSLEAAVLSKLVDPAIVAYVSHGLMPDDSPYLAMEWLEGESLEDRLDRSPLSIDETLRITRIVAGALSCAHAQGVIHRDLKPGNVWVLPDGRIKLLDFGIAKTKDVEGLTQTGVAVGTPGYMSPEQARGAKIDARSDLFALGCFVFACVTGERPFGTGDLLSYATRLALETAPRLRTIAKDAPPALDALVARLLEKDPALRPASALDVEKELAAIAPNERAEDTVDPLANTAAAPELVVPPARVVAKPAEATLRSEAATPPAPARSRPLLWAGVIAGLLGAIAFVSASGVFEGAPSRSASSAVPSIVPPAPSLSLASSVPSATPAEDDRAGLVRACRAWSEVLAKNQRTDGSFATDAHGKPSGWDTGQQLYALALAKRACDAVGPAPLTAGARALAKLHDVDGQSGPGDGPRVATTPANAWALLALAATRRETDDAALDGAIATAKSDLLRSKNQDGSFRYYPNVARAKASGNAITTSTASDLYATMLSAWALDETRGHDEASAASANAALAWLAKETAKGGEDAEVRGLGIAEEVAFIFFQHEASSRTPEISAAIAILARDTLAHCMLAAEGCQRPSSDTGRVTIGDSGRLVAMWQPWSGAASFAAAHDANIAGVSDREHADLTRMSRAIAAQLTTERDGITAAPEYKLAEYVIAVSTMLRSH